MKVVHLKLVVKPRSEGCTNADQMTGRTELKEPIEARLHLWDPNFSRTHSAQSCSSRPLVPCIKFYFLLYIVSVAVKAGCAKNVNSIYSLSGMINLSELKFRDVFDHAEAFKCL